MRWAIASTALLSLAACKRDAPPERVRVAPTASDSAPSAAPPPPPRPRPPAASAASSSSPRAVEKGPALSADAKTHDVATGAYAALAGELLVIRRKDGELATVRLGDKPTPLADDGVAFARGKTAVAPRGTGAAAYFVDAGKLVRRVVDDAGKTGPAEVLAEDAEEYPPHAAGLPAGDVVAYVARRTSKDGERRARLWVDGKGISDLSPDGSGAASVFLVPLGASRIAAVWMDQRAALAPIHGAWLELSPEPKIEREGVTWIAPPSELSSVVTAVRVGDAIVAFTAVPKDGSTFGLAAVPVSEHPHDDAVWLDYPNGLDPAPVVPLVLCDRPMVALVRPVARPIDAPRVLELATVEATGVVTPRLELARAGRIDHVTAWGTRDHGWVAWAGDGRTRVRRVRCGK